MEGRKKKEGKTTQPSGRAAVRTPVPGPPEDKLASFVRTVRPAPAGAFSTQPHPLCYMACTRNCSLLRLMSTAVCTVVTLRFHGAYQVVPCFQRTCAAVLVVGSLD